MDAAAAGLGAQYAADVAGADIAADGFQSGGSANGANLHPPRAGRALETASDGADPYIAAARDEFAISANAVDGEVAGAGIDIQGAIDAGGFDAAIGGRDDDLLGARCPDYDRGYDGTAGRREHDPFALRNEAHVVALHHAAGFHLSAGAHADAHGERDIAADARLHADRTVGIDTEAARGRRSA